MFNSLLFSALLSLSLKLVSSQVLPLQLMLHTQNILHTPKLSLTLHQRLILPINQQPLQLITIQNITNIIMLQLSLIITNQATLLSQVLKLTMNMDIQSKTLLDPLMEPSVKLQRWFKHQLHQSISTTQELSMMATKPSRMKPQHTMSHNKLNMFNLSTSIQHLLTNMFTQSLLISMFIHHQPF